MPPNGLRLAPAIPAARSPLPSWRLFASFLHDAVARYSQPPYSVTYWELGNEPDVGLGLVAPDNIYGCWGTVNDTYYGGEYYGKMLATVSPQMKAANPAAQVLVGGLLLDCDPLDPTETFPGSGQIADCRASTFLEGILKSGGGDDFDGVSFHAYDYYYELLGLYGSFLWHSSSWETGPVLVAKTRYFRGLLARYDQADKYLINTESGLICAAAEEVCNTPDFETTKAYYAAEAYASARAMGLRGNVWYSILGWRHSGLVKSNLEPYPAYQAFRFSSQTLNLALHERDSTEYPGLLGYAFKRLDDHLWVLWSLDSETHTIDLPAMPTAVFDVFGAELPAAQTLDVGLAPVYIFWPAD